MTDDSQVDGNLKGMDVLDFEGWNNADWHGAFAHHHTEDVLVDFKGMDPTRGIQEHIDAMEALKRLRRRRDRRGGGRGELKEWSLLGFDAAASSGETVGTGRSSSVTTGWRRPPRSAFAQVSGSFAQWAHQAIDAKPT